MTMQGRLKWSSAFVGGALLMALGACGGEGEVCVGVDCQEAQGESDAEGRFATQGDPQGSSADNDAQSGSEASRDDVAGAEGQGAALEHEAECESDSDCSGDSVVCSCLGECVDVEGQNPCTEPKNCGSGTWCDPCLGVCQPRASLCEPCSTAGLCTGEGGCRSADQAGCSDQGVCIPFASGGSYCGMACLSSAGCPSGYDCEEIDGAPEKQCVPVSGQCDALGLCGDDTECPEGQKCLEGPQVCAPGCVDDTGCPQGTVCDQARCVPPCSSDSECTLPELCDEGGHCKDPNACESWTECPPVHYCQKSDGQCVPGCQLDEQCADAGKVCEDGACVDKGCQHNYQCGFEEECEAEVGACGQMSRPHCSVCDAGAEDPSKCGGEPNICVTFQDAEGAEVGDFCLLTCDADPIDACPQGYACEQIQAPDAGIDGYYCVRQCWQEPY